MKTHTQIPNRRVGTYYVLGSLISFLVAFIAWPWTALFVWPALALACIAYAYFSVGGSIYRKRLGRVPFGVRIFLAPAHLGQVLSWQHYRRRSSAWNEALPGVLMGRVLTKTEAAALVDCGVTAILDLTAEFSETTALRNLEYWNIPLLDLTAPSTAQMHEAAEFISEQIESGNKVYVHCKVGYSRTAAVVGAFLLASGHACSARDVVAKLQNFRPGIVVRPEAWYALKSFATNISAGC